MDYKNSQFPQVLLLTRNKQINLLLQRPLQLMNGKLRRRAIDIECLLPQSRKENILALSRVQSRSYLFSLSSVSDFFFRLYTLSIPHLLNLGAHGLAQVGKPSVMSSILLRMPTQP